MILQDVNRGIDGEEEHHDHDEESVDSKDDDNESLESKSRPQIIRPRNESPESKKVSTLNAVHK